MIVVILMVVRRLLSMVGVAVVSGCDIGCYNAVAVVNGCCCCC